MKEAFGNLWDFDGWHCVTTNGYISQYKHRAVMGRGCAKEAADRWPQLPFKLGRKIHANGNHVYLFSELDLITFPVKHNWWERADLELIKQSAQELNNLSGVIGAAPVYLPRPGCGNGGLRWEEVKPVIEPILKSDQFTVVTWR